MDTLRDEILRAIERSGLTPYEIAKRSEVDRAILSRFINGTGGLTLASLEKLAPVIGIWITRKAARHAR